MGICLTSKIINKASEPYTSHFLNKIRHKATPSILTSRNIPINSNSAGGRVVIYIVGESRKQKTCGNGYNNDGGLLVKVEKDASGGEKHKMNKRHVSLLKIFPKILQVSWMKSQDCLAIFLFGMNLSKVHT